MEKKLFLLRHAEAVNPLSHEKDIDRELTSKGISQAHQIGVFLSENFYSPEIIYTSSAMRAEQTAKIAGEVIKIDNSKIMIDEELYNASVRTFFEFVSKVDEVYNNVLCVGHNPTISYLAEYLTREAIGDMSTAGLVIISFNISKWKEISQGNGTLVKSVAPEDLNKLADL